MEIVVGNFEVLDRLVLFIWGRGVEENIKSRERIKNFFLRKKKKFFEKK